ncbi:MAG: DUF6078 family protein [Parabacteroides sp.]
MPKKFYTSLPTDYPVCQLSDCPMAETCLHQISYPTLLEKNNILHLVNPNKCSKDAQCKFYRSNKPITYARGFAHFQKRMFPEQYDRFSMMLISQFGRNPYYERRRGDTALTPEEQRIVLDALKEVGVTEEMQFESYEENTNWYD